MVQTPPAPASDDVVEVDLSSPAFRAGSMELYKQLQAKCPVTRARVVVDDAPIEADPLFQREVYLVTGYDEASAFLLDNRFSVDPLSVMSPEQLAMMPPQPEELQPLSRNLLNVDPPDHTRLRKLVQPSFTNRSVEALRPRVREIAEGLVDAAEQAAAERGETAPHRGMELISQFSYPLPMTVIAELLGIPEADREQVRRWSEHLLSRQAVTNQEEIQRGLGEFIAYLKDLFARKRAHPADDLTSQLIAAEEDGDRLSEDELVAMVFVLIVAGHVTTVNLIANGVFALLTHPGELAKVRADRSLIPNLVEETLRYWGPAETTLPRFARHDLDLAGVPIRQGEAVIAVLGSADRSPERFRDPDRFDVTRDDAGRHIGFGKGIHVCLGAPLARLEAQVAFEVLLDRMPDLALGAPAEQVTWAPSFMRSLQGLPVTF